MRLILKLTVTALVFAAFSLSAFAADAPKVTLKTNMGDIVIELDTQRAPLTSQNFLKYVESGHYDGTIFHRVIDGFMIQGGGFEENMSEKDTFDPIYNEAANGLKNKKYTLAMARTPDPHSAAAQFFINVADNGFLDYPGQDGWGYAVFGTVVEGQDVVDQIAKVKTGNKGGHQNVPLEPVLIKGASILQ